MSRYVVTTPDKLPNPLRKGEMVINPPNFIEEIEASQNRNNSKRTLTTASYLRTIAQTIANNYDTQFNPLTHLRAHSYEGREFNSVQDLSTIVLEMLRRDYPVIFDRYLDTKIKQRPLGTKLIYWTGSHLETKPFLENGMEGIQQKDVDVYLGLKDKKTFGKPAITAEQAEKLTE